MKLKLLITNLFLFSVIVLHAQEKVLTKKEIREDLAFLTKTLNEKSSYVYLNGYDFKDDFENYLDTIGDATRLEDFGMFLTKTLANIGDRHSALTSIRGFSINESLFLPFIYAPEKDKVVVLNNGPDENFVILTPSFPYLKKIDGIAIDDFLQHTRPEDIRAPGETYFTMAVRDIRDIQKNYRLLDKPLPEKIRLTLSDPAFKNDTIIKVSVVDRSERLRPWDEKFERAYIGVKDEDYNTPEIIVKLFNIEDSIAYIRLPAMTDKEETPLLFDELHSFMASIRNNSKALIIDVRSNSGGTRDIMYAFAKYFVHPDSVYVVNVTKQRGPLPLPNDYRESLHNRFLFSFTELNQIEQDKATEFLATFDPMYELDKKKYSEYYFGLLNGRKLSKQAFHYDKPVYILANEKTFSAASVFVAVFKGLPNIHIAGITTDGSSGNSEWFDLPHSKLFGKISTMVSFQKNGKVLDGYGTAPDIEIERDMDQVLWKADSQLEHLRNLILNGS